MHVRSTPEGPSETGVFVHGLAGSATNWTDLMAELQDTITGYAVDLPGAGYSPPPPDGDYSVTAHARAVIAFLEHIVAERGGEPVHLFGNSLGGAVSVRVAATRPDLVRTLTLVAPALPHLVPRRGPARIAFGATPRIGDWVVGQLLRHVPAEKRVRATMAMCYADPSRVHPARVAEAVAEQRRRDELPHNGPSLVESARGIVFEYLKEYAPWYAKRGGAGLRFNKLPRTSCFFPVSWFVGFRGSSLSVVSKKYPLKKHENKSSNHTTVLSQSSIIALGKVIDSQIPTSRQGIEEQRISGERLGTILWAESKRITRPFPTKTSTSAAFPRKRFSPSSQPESSGFRFSG